MKKRTIESRAMRSVDKVLPFVADQTQVHGRTEARQQSLRRAWYQNGYVAGVQSEQRRARKSR